MSNAGGPNRTVIDRARAFRRTREPAKALPLLDAWLVDHPGDALGHGERALSRYQLGRFDGARADGRRLALLEPSNTRAWHFLDALPASPSDQVSRGRDARVAVERALILSPVDGKARLSQARHYLHAKNFNRAERAARDALIIDPGDSNAWIIFALSVEPLGETGKMVARLERVGVLGPDLARYRYWYHLALPPVVRSGADITYWRTRFRRGIDALSASGLKVDNPVNTLDLGYFFLAYHGIDNRAIIEALGRLYRDKAPALEYRAPALARWRAPAPDERRIRLGILSKYFSGHTIGRIFRGLITSLDPTVFDITLIHAPNGGADEITAEIEASVSAVIRLPADLGDQQREISDLALDILFYTDIGMAQETYLLAHSRLAPVQATAWGHPDTTGLPSMDYFISSAMVEPENADEFYSERLIRLSRLPCVYKPEPLKPVERTRGDLGLPASGVLYGCTQSLFKLHPDFDRVLADIARGDPDGTILLPEGNTPSWIERLRERWAEKHPVLLDRVHFFPNLRYEDFLALLNEVDILLDPPHFGAGSTMYDAMILGTPVVTWPGAFMRGRFVASAYRQMRIEAAPIASTLEDYADIVLALAKDPDRRMTLRAALKQGAKDHLFMDLSVTREYEQFFRAAIAGAGRNERLPVGWRPSQA
jgi:protein O-GlcNAc transferase